MLDMVQGSNPPTAAQTAAFDAEWAGTPHRDVCVTLVKGKATLKVIGLPNFEVYYVPQEATNLLESKDKIEISGENPNRSGVVCLGVQE